MITEPIDQPAATPPVPRNTRRLWYIGGYALAVVLIGAGTGIYVLYRRQTGPLKPLSANVIPKPTVTPAVPSPSPTPATQASHLTGLQVPTGTEYLRPLAVMIENTPEARPQAGLGEASLVYEAIAEGGITRFMAIYDNPSTAVTVGPVRSARPYYVDLAQELGALFAHAGGSQDGLAEITTTGIPNLDGLSIGSPIFYRSNPHNVTYEHTLYSTTDALWKYAGQQNFSTAGTYASWKFAPDSPAAAPTSTKISVSVAGADYANEWDYDATANSYKRQEGGAPQIDMNTSKQIAVKNVILQTVTRVDSTESYGSIVKPISFYTLTGSGSALVFENGLVTKATWKKTGSDRTRYYDATTGAELSFVAGQSWVQLVETGSQVSY